MKSNTIPFYYTSNEIKMQTHPNSLYFIFIHYMFMINPIVANEIVNSQSAQHYNELIYIHRFYVMYVIDILVIYNNNIVNIKNIIDSFKDKDMDKDFSISAIYGSYLPILYSLILNEIGFEFNALNKKPLDKLKDYDTLVLKILDDYIETHTDNEFMRENSILIGYYNNIDSNSDSDSNTNTNSDNHKPVSRSKIQSSSINSLICHCWDLNYTSAILLYEDYKQPYIIRHPDFTEFLFGLQPIQLLFGKNESNLYNYDITMCRLEKALNTWN